MAAAVFAPTAEEVAAVAFGVLYAAASAGETLAVKALNYNASLSLPAYTALLSNQLWVLMLPLYCAQRNERRLLKKNFFWSQYCTMGALTFIITILRNISVNVTPGSIFSLLISTSILFNIVLSKVVLKKVFTLRHAGAAVFCLGAAASIGFAALVTDREDFRGADLKLGVASAVAAAFFIAVMSVCQERMQRTWDSYDVRIVEMTIASSLVASALTAIYGLITNEVATWPPLLAAATAQSRDGLVLVAGVSCALPLLKLLVRNAKYATIRNSSAFFFEFAQSAGSLIGSIASILVFGEPWGVGYIAAIVLMTISFGLYIQTKKARAEAAAVPPPKPPSDDPEGDVCVAVNPIAGAAAAKQDAAAGSNLESVGLWK